MHREAKHWRALRSRSIKHNGDVTLFPDYRFEVVQRARATVSQLNDNSNKKIVATMVLESHQIDVTMDCFHWRSGDIPARDNVRCRNVIGPPVEIRLKTCFCCLSPSVFRPGGSRGRALDLSAEVTSDQNEILEAIYLMIQQSTKQYTMIGNC